MIIGVNEIHPGIEREAEAKTGTEVKIGPRSKLRQGGSIAVTVQAAADLPVRQLSRKINSIL